MTLEKKSIYRLVKILKELEEYQLDELRDVIEQIRKVLKDKISRLRIDVMIGKYYQVDNIKFLVTGLTEDGMLQVKNNKGRLTQLWVCSHNALSGKWQIVGHREQKPLTEITKQDYEKE